MDLLRIQLSRLCRNSPWARRVCGALNKTNTVAKQSSASQPSADLMDWRRSQRTRHHCSHSVTPTTLWRIHQVLLTRTALATRLNRNARFAAPGNAFELATENPLMRPTASDVQQTPLWPRPEMHQASHRNPSDEANSERRPAYAFDKLSRMMGSAADA